MGPPRQLGVVELERRGLAQLQGVGRLREVDVGGTMDESLVAARRKRRNPEYGRTVPARRGRHRPYSLAA